MAEKTSISKSPSEQSVQLQRKEQHLIEEELFQTADKKIVEVNKLGIAQGRTDISEPDQQHLPVLISMESFETFLWGAVPYAIDKRLRTGEEKSVGKKIEVQDMLENVTKRDGQTKKCRNMMVLAPAGMGKTTLLRRIAQNARRGDYKKLVGKLVLVLDFRPHPKREKILPSQALLGNMFSDWGSDRMKQRYQWIVDNHEKVVFIIDSLDTLPFDLEKGEHLRLHGRPEYHKPATADVILCDILAKYWFPDSIIISSSREYKVRNLHPSFYPDRCVLLDGLTEESVEDLIDGFLGKAGGVEVKRHIKIECPEVWPLLSIPVVLVFSMIGFGQDGPKPKTLSAIVIKFFLSLIRSSHVHVKDILTVLKKLMPLAFAGTRHLQVLFTPDELRRFGLEPEEAIDLGVIIPHNQETFPSTKLMQSDRFFLYFNHQTQQEALAALYVLSTTRNDFKIFIDSYEIWERHFTVVRRLICGTLLNDEVLESAQELIEISDIDQKKNMLIQSLGVALEEYQRQPDKKKLLELFIDLSECKEGVTELIRSSVKTIYFNQISLSPTDVQAVAFVMKQSKYLELVVLQKSNLNDDKMKILLDTITQSNVKVKELNVSDNKELGVKGAHLLGTLVKNHGVKRFRAGGSIRGYESVEKFIQGLGDAKIDDLILWDNNETSHTPSLLDLLPHVKNQLDLYGWKINESQQQELQQRLNEIGSPSLKVLILDERGGVMDLKASVMDLTSGITNRDYASGARVVKDASIQPKNEAEKEVADIVRDDRTETATSEASVETSASGTSIVISPETSFASEPLGTETKLESKISTVRNADLGEIEIAAKISAEIERRIKTESTKIGAISAEGGFLENDGSKVTFRRGAFDKNTEVQTSVITDFSDCPEGLVPIAPSIKCSPSGKLNQPAHLEIDHWALPTDGHVYIEVYRKDTEESERQFFKKVCIEANQKISFYTEHFTLYEFFMKCASMIWSGLIRPFAKVTLQNLVYISGVGHSIACVCCLQNVKVEENVTQVLKNFHYYPLLAPETTFAYKGGTVKMKIKCSKPDNLHICLEDDHVAKEIENVFLVDTILTKCKEFRYLPIALENGDLKKFDDFLRFQYSHTTEEDNVQHTLQIVWPIPGAAPTHMTNIRNICHFYGNIRTDTILAPNQECNQ